MNIDKKFLRYLNHKKEELETQLRLYEIPNNYKREVNLINNLLKDLKKTNRELEKLKKEIADKHERNRYS